MAFSLFFLSYALRQKKNEESLVTKNVRENCAVFSFGQQKIHKKNVTDITSEINRRCVQKATKFYTILFFLFELEDIE